MDVCVAESFPRVIRYEMKEGELAGKVFYGQTEEINTIRINGIDIALDAGSVNAEFSENQWAVLKFVQEWHRNASFCSILQARAGAEVMQKEGLTICSRMKYKRKTHFIIFL